MGATVPDEGLKPKTLSGWVVGYFGIIATTVVATPFALAAAGAAVVTGRDHGKAYDAVMEPAFKALAKGVEVADKHNEAIIRAGINSAIANIGHRSGSQN
ncbi:hypothetical protein [Streptomyces sp. NPDC002057]|uniref:hypothetical protein n=1 Tax=Streptomyces sp. NPDC002057 TaxID=3154664 RepID=UPI00331B23A4